MSATEPETRTESVAPRDPDGDDSQGARTYGPSALRTPANLITVLRLLAAPVFVAMILVWGANWIAFAFGGVLAFSDGIDGWVARRHGATSSGAFLDPLADKVAVLGALYALVANGTFSWLPVTIIAVREIAMSVYRSVMGRRGVSIPARNSAKLKTLLQDLAIGLCLAPPLVTYTGLQKGVLWVAAGLTVVTGVQYYLDGRRAAHRRRAGSGGTGAAPGNAVSTA